jgi:hypothetical protein
MRITCFLPTELSYLQNVIYGYVTNLWANKSMQDRIMFQVRKEPYILLIWNYLEKLNVK